MTTKIIPKSILHRKRLGVLTPFNIKQYIADKRVCSFKNWLFFINTGSDDTEWSEELVYEKLQKN